VTAMVDKTGAREPDEGGNWVPRPDPTLLTTSQLLREVAALEAKINTRFDAMDKAVELLQAFANKSPTIDVVAASVVSLEKVCKARLDAISGNIDSLRGESERRLDEAMRETKHAQELRDEKFLGIYAALEAVKEAVQSRFVQQETALAAAFAAAKEAVAEQNKSNALSITKSETTFTKNIDQLGELVKTMGIAIGDKIETSNKSANDKIDDLKGRLTALESRTSVSDPTTSMALRDMSNSIGSLRTGADTGSGRSKGMSESGNILALGISAVFALVGIVSVIFHFGH
jgi:hypothetical protein